MARRLFPFTLLICAVCLPAPAPAVAQGPPARASVDSASVALARRLLKAMRYSENLVAGVEMVFTEERKAGGDLPAVFYDSLLARMRRTAPEAVDSIAPVYARQFTAPELEAMARFFESAPGQKLAGAEATLNIETTKFGQRWGARLAAQIIKDLVDAGVDITKP